MSLGYHHFPKIIIGYAESKHNSVGDIWLLRSMYLNVYSQFFLEHTKLKCFPVFNAFSATSICLLIFECPYRSFVVLFQPKGHIFNVLRLTICLHLWKLPFNLFLLILLIFYKVAIFKHQKHYLIERLLNDINIFVYILATVWWCRMLFNYSTLRRNRWYISILRFSLRLRVKKL